MINWVYQIDGVELAFQQNENASYTGDLSKFDTVDDVSAAIDVEINRLSEVINDCERNIYKLKKWRQVARRKEE